MTQRRSTSAYPADWPDLARRIKDEAGWSCVRCGHAHDVRNGYVLTVHHLDLSPANRAWWNLLPLCQRCHLSIQARVVLERPWILEHSDWFKPYVAGWYAHRYRGEDLTRGQVMARLDDLLALERDTLFAQPKGATP